MMINARRLTGLTQLSLIGFPNLVGDAPVAALSTSLPPDLTVLELELTIGGLPVDYRNEVKDTGCKSFAGKGVLSSAADLAPVALICDIAIGHGLEHCVTAHKLLMSNC